MDKKRLLILSNTKFPIGNILLEERIGGLLRTYQAKRNPLRIRSLIIVCP